MWDDKPERAIRKEGRLLFAAYVYCFAGRGNNDYEFYQKARACKEIPTYGLARRFSSLSGLPLSPEQKAELSRLNTGWLILSSPYGWPLRAPAQEDVERAWSVYYCAKPPRNPEALVEKIASKLEELHNSLSALESQVSKSRQEAATTPPTS